MRGRAENTKYQIHGKRKKGMFQNIRVYSLHLIQYHFSFKVFSRPVPMFFLFFLYFLIFLDFHVHFQFVAFQKFQPSPSPYPRLTKCTFFPQPPCMSLLIGDENGNVTVYELDKFPMAVVSKKKKNLSLAQVVRQARDNSAANQ